MPTSATTGTKGAVEEAAKAKAVNVVKPESTPAPGPGPAPLADFSDGGIIHVTTGDGATTGVNTGEEGWEDKVRELDPKHQSIYTPAKAAKTTKARKES